MSNSIILFLVVKTLGPISDDYIKAQDCVCLSNLYNETATTAFYYVYYNNQTSKAPMPLLRFRFTPLKPFQTRKICCKLALTPGPGNWDWYNERTSTSNYLFRWYKKDVNMISSSQSFWVRVLQTEAIFLICPVSRSAWDVTAFRMLARLPVLYLMMAALCIFKW